MWKERRIEDIMQLKHTFEYIEVDGQILIVSLEKEENDSFEVIKLNQSAGEILNLLKEGKDKYEMEICLRQYYDVSWELLKTDVDIFLKQLWTVGMLIMDGNCTHEIKNTETKGGKSFIEKQQWMKPKIEVIQCQVKEEESCGSTGHSHCKSPFGRDYSHE